MVVVKSTGAVKFISETDISETLSLIQDICFFQRVPK